MPLPPPTISLPAPLDGAFVLRPVGIPGVEVRRRLDADGHMIWTRPDLGGIEVVLERISEETYLAEHP